MPTVDIEGVGRVQFPDGMTPEQITAAIESEIVPKQPRTTGQEVARQGGLTARHATEGLLALPGMIANVPGAIANKGLELAGSDYRFPDQNQAIHDLLTRLGLPQPETATERVVGAGSRAAAGTGGTIALAKLVPGAVSNLIQMLPGRQAASAATGAGSSETVKEMGGGPLAQVAAGVAGGVAAPIAIDAGQSLVRGAGRFATGLGRTMTRAGQEKIAGRALREQATDPGRAQENLRDVNEIVPDSVPTSGAASKDIGLLALEKGLRSQAPARFGNRLSEQNLARQSILDEIAGTKADIIDAKRVRDAVTGPMRGKALGAGETIGSPGSVVADKIDEILASPIGKRDVPAQALQWVKNKIGSETDPRKLYAIRQDVGDAMAGKLGGEEAKFRLARRELMEIQSVLDDAIEAGAPGFKAYLARYREMSRPINQKEILQEIQKRATLAAPDVSTGREFLSQAKFRNAVNLAAKKGNLDKLSPDQLKAINAIAADLDLGAAFSSSSVRAPGSDTFQNLSMANAIGAATGGRSQVPQWLQPVMRPFTWLMKGSDERINELLVDAMLDPKLAAQMMQRATPKNAHVLSATLRQRANAISRGATLGASTERQEQSEAEALQ